MGLKDTLIGTIASKTLEKIAVSGRADDIVNNTIEKISKVTKEKTSASEIEIKRKYCIKIKVKSNTIKSVAKEMLGLSSDSGEFWGKYRIVDSSDNLKYVSELKEPSSILSELVGYDKDTLYVFDTNERKIGKIKENIFSHSDLIDYLFEKDAKRCTIYLHGEELFDVKRYLEEDSYDVGSCDYRIDYDGGVDIRIKNRTCVIAEAHRITTLFKDEYLDRYIIEYDNPDDELPLLLLVLAIDMLQ